MKWFGEHLRFWHLAVLIALNAPLVLLVLLKNTWQLHLDAISWVYLISVSLGYYLLAIYILASVVYLVLSPFRKLAIIVSGTIVTIALFYLIVDSFTFAIVKMHIDLFWLKWIINDFAAFGLSPSTLRSAIFALLVLVALELGIAALVRKFKRRKFVVPAISILLPVFLVISQVFHALAYESNDVRITQLTPRLPLYLPVTSHRNAARYSGVLPIGEEEYLDSPNDREGTLRYPLHPLRYDSTLQASTPNILVLFFESWRFDAISDSVTPHTYALARKSTLCLNHFSAGNSTVAGVFGFFYGLHPTYWPAVKAENAAIHNPVLIDELRKRGYAFGIFARSNFKRHKIKDAVFRGIDVQEDFAGQTAVEQDVDMTNRLNEFIREQSTANRPFFAFAFYKSNHAPYRYPPTDTLFRPAGDLNLMSADADTDPTEYMNDYRNATYYVDRLIGDVLQSLDNLHLMDNTVIIISTDHGEEFNDNRSTYWGHTGDYTRFQTQVPLVLYIPNRPPQSIEHTTTHVDVVPTLLKDVFGCVNEVEDYSSGQNLMDTGYQVRPLIIGSYVNHAFIVGNNVFQVNAFGVSSYTLDDINGSASNPPPEALKRIAVELGWFFDDDNSLAEKDP